MAKTAFAVATEVSRELQLNLSSRGLVALEAWLATDDPETQARRLYAQGREAACATLMRHKSAFVVRFDSAGTYEHGLVNSSSIEGGASKNESP